MSPALSIYLDLMRLLAAGMVFLMHANGQDVSGKIIWRVASFGTDGVIFFFVLSGFVISFVSARREHSARRFFVARAARIYSVAVVAIPATLIGDAVGWHMAPGIYQGHSFFNPQTGAGDVVASLVFLNEVWQNHIIIGSNEPYWSLGFEVWYYIIFGLALSLRGVARVGAVVLALAVAGPKIVFYLPIWLLGGLLFWLTDRAHRAGRAPLPRWASWLLFTGAPALYLAVHAHPPTLQRIYGSDFALDAPHFVTWAYYAAIAVLFAAHIVGFIGIAPAFSRLLQRCGPAIRWAAGASFTFYLVHQPLLFCFASLSPFPVGALARLMFVTFCTLAAVLALAELGERRKPLWHRAIDTGLDALAVRLAGRAG